MFVSECDSWAAATGAAFLLIGHPPKSTAVYSGSTDWRNGPRSVITLERAKVDGLKDATDKKKKAEGVRLRVDKSNYAKQNAHMWVRMEARRDSAGNRLKMLRWEECSSQESAYALAVHDGKPQPLDSAEP